MREGARTSRLISRHSITAERNPSFIRISSWMSSNRNSGMARVKNSHASLYIRMLRFLWKSFRMRRTLAWVGATK